VEKLKTGFPLDIISAICLGSLENKTFKKGNNIAMENKENTTDNILKTIFNIP
jgi:hypothetical protein